MTYWVFLTMSVALMALCVTDGVYGGFAYKPGPVTFTALIFVVACGMGIGKASVYKYTPDYYPDDVGAVGGLVEALGAFGGFYLPPIFGYLGRTTGNPRMAFLSRLHPDWDESGVVACHCLINQDGQSKGRGRRTRG